MTTKVEMKFGDEGTWTRVINKDDGDLSLHLFLEMVCSLCIAPKKAPIFAVKEGLVGTHERVVSVYGGIQCNKVI